MVDSLIGIAGLLLKFCPALYNFFFPLEVTQTHVRKIRDYVAVYIAVEARRNVTLTSLSVDDHLVAFQAPDERGKKVNMPGLLHAVFAPPDSEFSSSLSFSTGLQKTQRHSFVFVVKPASSSVLSIRLKRRSWLSSLSRACKITQTINH